MDSVKITAPTLPFM